MNASNPLGLFFATQFLKALHQSGTSLRFSFFPFSKFFLMLNLGCHLLLASPIGQAVALMVKDVVHTRKIAHLPVFFSLINPRHGASACLIKRDLLPDFGLCNPQIIALHDLGGIVAILNRFAHLRNRARQETGIISGLGHRKNAVPFGPELIAGLKLVPHPFGIPIVKKIALLCACVASRLSGRCKCQEAQYNGI